jgi:hypothetical protein
MPMYVYSADGEAVGFLFESFLFDFEGTALGRLFGSRIHRLDGSYAGEWFHQMVVERRDRPVRSLLPARRQPRPPIPPRPEPRRHVAEYGLFPNVFHLLYLPDALQAAE